MWKCKSWRVARTIAEKHHSGEAAGQTLGCLCGSTKEGSVVLARQRQAQSRSAHKMKKPEFAASRTAPKGRLEEILPVERKGWEKVTGNPRTKKKQGRESRYGQIEEAPFSY